MKENELNSRKDFILTLLILATGFCFVYIFVNNEEVRFFPSVAIAFCACLYIITRFTKFNPENFMNILTEPKIKKFIGKIRYCFGERRVCCGRSNCRRHFIL